MVEQEGDKEKVATTTIKITLTIRDDLIRNKVHPRETYNQVIDRLLNGAELEVAN